LEISKALMTHIESEIRRVKYGRITIELNEHTQKIDVVTECRKRFKKDPPEGSPAPQPSVQAEVPVG